jgi:hypothetical protein
MKMKSSNWVELRSRPINTLQMFITNRCDKHCRGCFYEKKLGKGKDMSLETYIKHIKLYRNVVGKIVILGGEPTLHEDLNEMVRFNYSSGLKTTIYTNGRDLPSLVPLKGMGLTVRVGVLGCETSAKPLSKLSTKDIKAVNATIVIMLNKRNSTFLHRIASEAEKRGCKKFYISSIRDILKTKDFWTDTEETVSNADYFGIITTFLSVYEGNMDIHVACRGVFPKEKDSVPACRFGNIFPDGSKIICPLDISLEKTTPVLSFNRGKCGKANCCILQKKVYRREVAT